MLGYIEYDGEGGAARLSRETRLGGTFLVLNLGRGAKGFLAGRRAARAAGEMRERGVRRAVFPVDFPHTAVFLRHGILPVDPLPLRRALCARFVRSRLDALGIGPDKAVVAVAGDYVSSEMEETVLALARSYRYVLCSVRSGGEEFARLLRRQYGTAILLDPSDDQLERADALVLFAPRTELRKENPVLCSLYPGGEAEGSVPLRLDVDFSEQIPPNCSRDQLAAALYSLGVLSAERFLGEITC